MDEVSDEKKEEEMSTPQEGDSKSKRKMKTAFQLELLEKTYAVETYPSEAVRADLSVKLGLSDRQLQMWFCHRRLKDRKTPTTTTKRQKKDSPGEAGTTQSGVGDDLAASSEAGGEHFPALGSVSGASSLNHGRAVPRNCGVALARIGDLTPAKRYFESPETVMEMRAIAFVEAQLGEPLREDGPILGMEFDPLPPDAFGAPLGTVEQPKHIGRSYDMKILDRTEFRLPKGASRALHEYQFLPEQPTVKAETYERGNPSHYYGCPPEGPGLRAPSLSAGRIMHGNELPIGYGFQSPILNAHFLPQHGRQGHAFSSGGEYETVPRKTSLPNLVDPHYGTTPINMLETPDLKLTVEEDALRLGRKRKSDEARVAKELEANEKRIRKELEKQDLLRRKKEEQMRKDMERQDRERRKEEERMLREKLREEERFQKEQRRELERREKFLQKESIRAERLRQKEELRREKEAARLKAANDRAIARRIAKESMELIEDERLELMELAASMKGLPSLLSLDYETLQSLETYRDMLSAFPPTAVKLKKPFAIPPWADSEENVGNLFMVWKFLQTFADVLGLWPFTLDEFLQALHDYDPRILSELHIAILRCIIKDIEDVARTPSTGLGTNQYNAAVPGGGHPEIVEGAYAWGFDIRSWQRHLNPLTWPEVLRQLALSAGFGPKLKKANIESIHRDDQEGNNCEAIISKLRNGTAAENAVAIMNERGYSNPRKSRHRLTPGTVKFAAFHILSLEGSKGITILEVADKIQKSGLRDLTTSRTPEASIAAALSRDTTLFERTAPSTYCVRPAYRKDPADAEALLSAAREKIRLFKNGLPDAEEVDDVERDEDSESDVPEDPEVEDLCNDPICNTDAEKATEVVVLPPTSTMSNGNEASIAAGETPEASSKLSSMGSEVLKDSKHDGTACFNQTDSDLGMDEKASTPNQNDMDIDEGYSGEHWVQGLVEGEYSNLSVEERLYALVALVGLAIEGNSIRLVLEERLEAATTLKKQMWVEAQVDKRRVRDDFVLKVHHPSLTGGRSEMGTPNTATEGKTPNTATEGKQSPVPALNDNGVEALGSQPDRCSDLQVNNSYCGYPSTNLIQDFSFGPDNIQIQLSGHAFERSRSQLKSVIGQKAEDTYVYRSLPLGQDRRRNRYWQFVTSASANEPGSSRIFVELRDGRWRLIDEEQDFDTLLASLDVRGTRESHLCSMLQNVQNSFKGNIKRKLHIQPNIDKQSGDQLKLECCELNSHPDVDTPSSGVYMSNSDPDPSSSFAIELGKSDTESSNALARYQDFQKWAWSECFSSSSFFALKYGQQRTTQLLGICGCCHDSYYFEDDHCPVCHGSFGKSDSSLSFADHVTLCEQKLQMEPNEIVYPSNSLPLRVRLLKVLLALVEVSIPSEALQSSWTDTQRLEWGAILNSSKSSEELLQALTQLEGVISRGYLSPTFETTNELLSTCKSSYFENGNSSVPTLPWIPKTTAAVALRLMELDTAIYYTQQQKHESQKEEAGNYLRPSTYDGFSNHQDAVTPSLHETPNPIENWVNHGTGQGSSKHKRGNVKNGNSGRTRNERSRPKVSGSKSETGRKALPADNGPLGQILGWKGATLGGGRSQGRRTARTRQRPGKSVMEINNEQSTQNFTPVKSFETTPGSLNRNEWSAEMRTPDEDVENSSSSSEYDEDNIGQGLISEEYNNITGVYNNQSGVFNNLSEDEYEEDHGVEAEVEEQADVDVGRYINEYSDEEGNDDPNAGPDYMLDDPAATGSSSDYSD